MSACCCYCDEPCDVLLDPPRLAIPKPIADYDYAPGSLVDWQVPGDAWSTASFAVVEVDGDRLIVLAPEAVADGRYCYRCWAGHTFPSIHAYLVNTPAQLHLDGWRTAEWSACRGEVSHDP